MRTVSAEVTHPLHAKQSTRDMVAILSAPDLIKLGLGFSTGVWLASRLKDYAAALWSFISMVALLPAVPTTLGLIHSRDGVRKSSKSPSLFANIVFCCCLF